MPEGKETACGFAVAAEGAGATGCAGANPSNPTAGMLSQYFIVMGNAGHRASSPTPPRRRRSQHCIKRQIRRPRQTRGVRLLHLGDIDRLIAASIEPANYSTALQTPSTTLPPR